MRKMMLTQISCLVSVCVLAAEISFAKTELFHGSKSKVSTIDLTGTSSAWDFRKTHRVGLGVVAGGAYGIFGAALDLNLSPRWSFGIGTGRGDPFQTVVVSMKRYTNLWDSSWLPFFGLNVSRWENFGSLEPIIETTPSYLGSTFMSEADRSRGKIRSTILNPTLGLQYTQLTGEWRGFVMGIELGVMAQLSGNGVIPSGAFQFGYVF